MGSTLTHGPSLDTEKTLSIIKPEGLLSQSLPGFESRVEQQDMMNNIIDAYNNSKIALIEAGTGTGKSIAYLIPAMLWAIKHKERTIISTNTINLQEQLLFKEIPLLKEALGLDIKAVLVKGMGNYLCLRKLHDARQEPDLYPTEESSEMEKIEAWSQNTKEGSRSELSFVPKASTWEKVCCESDTCNRDQCPHFSKCHFFKARKEAEDANILISNHSLLFTDLSYRAENDQGLLPDYEHIILDEAHNIEDIATEHFATKVSGINLLRTLARLSTERQGKIFGKIPALKMMLQNHFKTPDEKIQSILHRIENDLQGQRRMIGIQCIQTFDTIVEFIGSFGGVDSSEDETRRESKLRILPEHHNNVGWKENVLPKCQTLIQDIKKYIQTLVGIQKDIEYLKDKGLNDLLKTLFLEITALSGRLEALSTALDGFMDPNVSDNHVRWVESYMVQSMPHVTLIDAQLDISKILVNHLFSKFSTVVLCSATLSTNNQFDFIKSRLGLVPGLLPDKEVTENIYTSPFDYERQSMLIVPTDIPEPSHPQFLDRVNETIWFAIQASRGNAFVLFTSYAMMNQCYKRLEGKLKEARYFPLKQGDTNRRALIDTFKATNRSVLFGTDSFWEGVDVVGEALRSVIIVKLPFKVPSEPIIQARSEAIAARGGEPFMEYAIPHAIVKFKQGFGRLIRKKQDRGCIVCLDSRLIKKNYGKLFLNSLPNCQKSYITIDKLYSTMAKFYKETYHLVK